MMSIRFRINFDIIQNVLEILRFYVRELRFLFIVAAAM